MFHDEGLGRCTNIAEHLQRTGQSRRGGGRGSGLTGRYLQPLHRSWVQPARSGLAVVWPAGASPLERRARRYHVRLDPKRPCLTGSDQRLVTLDQMLAFIQNAGISIVVLLDMQVLRQRRSAPGLIMQ